MFDLDLSIADWRRQMAAGGVRTTEVLDELEGHLRDDVEGQVHSGCGERQAFRTAVHRIGPANALRAEFETARLNLDHPNQPMKQKLIRILASIAVMFIAVGLILPALAKLNEQGALARFDIAMLLVGTVGLAGSAMFGAYHIANALKQRSKA